MNTQWSWDLLDASEARVGGDGPVSPAFPTQSEAESWIGEVWPELVDAGVDSVTLREGDTVVYGPMSLRPAQ